MIVRAITGFARFWYHFIVGDDWTIAAGVAAGLVISYALLRGGHPQWWLLPVVVIGLLSASLRRSAS